MWDEFLVVVERDRVRVEPVGELDIAAVGALSRAMARALTSGRHIVVDLSATTFLDASGVGALVRSYHAARAQGVTIQLNPSATPLVRRVLDVTGVDELFSPGTQ